MVSQRASSDESLAETDVRSYVPSSEAILEVSQQALLQDSYNDAHQEDASTDKPWHASRLVASSEESSLETKFLGFTTSTWSFVFAWILGLYVRYLSRREFQLTVLTGTASSAFVLLSSNGTRSTDWGYGITPSV